MPSELLPDDVEVFHGSTLEEAMAGAIDALGGDLTVTSARKVKRGLPGMKGKEHFEVLARRPVSAAEEDAAAVVGAAEDVVDSAFAALLASAEEDERVTTAATLPRPRTDSHPAPEVVVDPVAPRAAQKPVARRLPAAAEPEVPVVAAPVAKAPARPAAAAKRKRTAAKQPAAPGWSRAALARLGVPQAVLKALPAKPPTTDLGWVRAVERAVARTVPAQAVLGPQAPVVLSGYGVEGVVSMLRTAVDTGLPLGVITLDGGRVALATPTEIALVLRAAVLGQP